jgi:hypothetical protein
MVSLEILIRRMTRIEGANVEQLDYKGTYG